MGQAAYGYSISKNISNTLVYSVGMYLAINNKKKKKPIKIKLQPLQPPIRPKKHRKPWPKKLPIPARPMDNQLSITSISMSM